MIDQQMKKRAVHRAKIIEGQMAGLTRAIDREDYCIDLITQSMTIQESLKSLNKLLLENHLKSHVTHQMTKSDTQEKAIKELLKIYKLSVK